MARGRFITLEGGEGAGKSTQAKLLEARLRKAGHEVAVTREPGGSERAEKIREVLISGDARQFGPFAEAVLFAAARTDHLEKTIRPALDKGVWVVCDRFSDSTRAYQGAAGGVEEGDIALLEEIAVGETRPDMTLILDLPPEKGLERAGTRNKEAGNGEDRFEQEDMAFHEKLRQAFLSIAEVEPERCVVIDADRNPEEIAEDIWSAVNERLSATTDNADG